MSGRHRAPAPARLPLGARVRNPSTTFAVIMAGVGTFALLQSFVAPVLPTIQQRLDTTPATVPWVMTAYLLSASIFTPVLGRLGDRIGKKQVFVAALIALALGSLLAAVAPGIGVMLVARVIQGIGGGVLPLAFGIARDELPPQKVRAAVGALASLAAVGSGVGLVSAGPIMHLLGYAWLFWLPLIVTSLAAVAACFVVPASPRHDDGPVDVRSALLFAGWLIALLLGISWAPRWGWTSGSVIALLTGAAVLAILWVCSELRAATPLIDLRLMARRLLWSTNSVALLIGVALFGLFTSVPQLVQTPVTSGGYGLGLTPTESGLVLLPLTVTSFLAGMAASRLVALVGPRGVVVAGCVVAAVSMWALAHHHSLHELYVLTGTTGVGFGLVLAAMASSIVAAVRPNQTGVASGTNANVRNIGGALGTSLVATVVASSAPVLTGLPPESAYQTGFIIMAAVLGLAAVAGLFIPGRRPTAEPR